jgi:hypothetical protein
MNLKLNRPFLGDGTGSFASKVVEVTTRTDGDWPESEGFSKGL